MEAALIAARRGHSVTLYEAQQQLGGALIAAGMPDFKWPVRSFCQYMIHQVEKSDIDVRLGVTASAEELSRAGYDHVIAAVGGTPLLLPIPGAERAIPGPEAFLHPEQISGDTVIVGGGEIGVECGIYLARLGHNVTILEMTGEYAKEANRPHYYTTLLANVKAEEKLTILLNAKVSNITPSAVEYTDPDGNTHSVTAESDVLSAGTRARTAEAMELYSAGDTFSMVGDCQKVGSIMEAMRTGFAAASQI